MVTASKVMLLVGATNWKSRRCTQELTIPLTTNLSLRSDLWKCFAFIIVLDKNNKGGSLILQGTRGERTDESSALYLLFLSKAPPALPSHTYQIKHFGAVKHSVLLYAFISNDVFAFLWLSPPRRVFPHCSKEPGSPGESPIATDQKHVASNSWEEQSNWDPKKQERWATKIAPNSFPCGTHAELSAVEKLLNRGAWKTGVRRMASAYLESMSSGGFIKQVWPTHAIM